MVIGYGYSSCLYAVESNPEKDVYFGTTHGHSNWSIDAFGLGNQKAVYYVRVLEIPTPRWSTYDAVKLGLPPSDMVPATIFKSLRC